MKIQEIGELSSRHEKSWAAAMGSMFHREALPFLPLIMRYSDGDELHWKFPLRYLRCGHTQTFGDDTLQARFGRACVKALQDRRPEFLRAFADLAAWCGDPSPGWAEGGRMIAISGHFADDNSVPTASEVAAFCWKKFERTISAQEIRRWFRKLNLPLRLERKRKPASKPDTTFRAPDLSGNQRDTFWPTFR